MRVSIVVTLFTGGHADADVSAFVRSLRSLDRNTVVRHVVREHRAINDRPARQHTLELAANNCYKVGRVDQCETALGAEIRNKDDKKAGKGKGSAKS
jgi:hypothetical protein